MYLLIFFSFDALYADPLFAFTDSPVQGGGDVVFGQLPAGPLPADSEGVPGQVLARQLVFLSFKI